MRSSFIMLSAMGASIWVCGASLAWAQDLSAGLAVGGLVFSRNADVSIESEDLTIAPDAVVVRYVLLNQSASPITLTMAFPLPDIDLEDGANITFPVNDPVNFIGYTTKIDGKPVNFTVSQRAVLGNKDMTAALRSMGMPVLPLGALQLKMPDLPQPMRMRAVNEGLLAQAGTDDKGTPFYEPTWTVKTSLTRQQIFPPGKPVSIEHRYRTSAGMSFDSVLRQGLRQTKGLESEVQRYKTNYCFSDDFLKSLDRIAGAEQANTAKILERRISYVLKAGANWAGTIKNFHLVVDKGQVDRIVSFCADGIKKISATAFEMRATDFTPTRDLNILLLGRK